MSENSMGLVMDKEVNEAFEKVYNKIEALRCVEYGIEIATIKKGLENGEKFAEKYEDAHYKRRSLEVNILRIAVAFLGITIAAIALIPKILEML